MSSLVRFREAVRRENAGRERLGYRYSEEQRALAVSYLRAALSRGLTKSEVSSQLGVSYVTLDRWSKEATPAFHPVEVMPAEAERSGAVLRSPSGWRIEGLSVREMISVLRGFE